MYDTGHSTLYTLLPICPPSLHCIVQCMIQYTNALYATLLYTAVLYTTLLYTNVLYTNLLYTTVNLNPYTIHHCTLQYIHFTILHQTNVLRYTLQYICIAQCSKYI